MTTQRLCSRGERLSKGNVHRCRRSHFSARALITNPSSVFGPSSRICIARASSLASSRTGACCNFSKKEPRKSSVVSGSTGCGGCDRLFIPFPRGQQLKNTVTLCRGCECEVVHTSRRFRPSKVRHTDIGL